VNHSSRRGFGVVIAVIVLAAAPMTASATHSWGGYHWARTANPFTVKLGDNVTSAWDSYLATTSSDWTASAVLDAPIVRGGSRSVRLCDATAGQVQVCNSRYGTTGWLGVASIWASGTHITKATVKLNDTYFSSAYYNTPAWRNLVSCQEVGHTFGLDHQDEAFDNANLDTCMDYTSSPESNQHPNQHDYDELVTIYSHLDSTSTLTSASSAAALGAGRAADAAWGRLAELTNHGRGAWFVRDLGSGDALLTHVLWAN
jgi:hypothetical protein